MVKQLKNSDSPAYQAVLRKVQSLNYFRHLAHLTRLLEQVLQHPEDPQDSLAHQLVANERYLMTSYFGGQGRRAGQSL